MASQPSLSLRLMTLRPAGERYAIPTERAPVSSVVKVSVFVSSPNPPPPPLLGKVGAVSGRNPHSDADDMDMERESRWAVCVSGLEA